MHYDENWCKTLNLRMILIASGNTLVNISFEKKIIHTTVPNYNNKWLKIDKY